jgi:penicillin-binding protein 1A
MLRAWRARLGSLAAHLGRWRPAPRVLVVLVVVVLSADWVLWHRCGLSGCPDVMRLRAYQPNGAPVLYDRRGRPWGVLRPVDRVIVPIDSLPWYVPAAFVAVEDKRFYHHHGVDWRRVLGAALHDLRTGGYGQGFSTIPMQLARNVWSARIPGQEKTLRRKLLEMRVAFAIERRFSKQEILELYLNNIYFGDGAYGVEAAARDYFHRSARKLTLAQAALLAALPRGPATYDPRDHPERARRRRDLVLSLMASGGFASGELTAAAAARPLGVSAEPARVPGEGIGRYFAELVRRRMEARFGEYLYRSRMKIVTSLDMDAQRAAEEELARQLRAIEAGRAGAFRGPRYRANGTPNGSSTSYLQGAVVVMDAHNGDVLALVGGRDFDQSRFNRALQGRRQTGSAFKPFVYARALQVGVPASQHLLDEPTTFMVGRRPWTPRDFGNRYRGDVTMRDALAHSLNVPTVRLAQYVGVPGIIALAHGMGLSVPIPNSPAAALGLAEVSPLELTAAYSAFATLGTRVEPRIIRRVLSEDGEVLWQAPPPTTTPVLDPGVAYIVDDMLRDVVDHGTGTAVRAAGFNGPVAGKTGTTSDAADAWFVGFTPDVVGTVWIGFDRRREIARYATGGGAAAPVWGRMMRRVYASWPAQSDWQQPDDVVSLAIDPESGQTLQAGCSPPYEERTGELFLTSAEPLAICPAPTLLGRPIRGIGGFLAGLWHAITGERAPPLPQMRPPQPEEGPYDAVLGARRVLMSSTPAGSGNGP